MYYKYLQETKSHPELKDLKGLKDLNLKNLQDLQKIIYQPSKAISVLNRNNKNIVNLFIYLNKDMDTSAEFDCIIEIDPPEKL